MNAQAKQRDYSGQWIYRWHVTLLDGRRIVTWAHTRKDAQRKAAKRGLIQSVAPAPHALDVAVRAEKP